MPTKTNCTERDKDTSGPELGIAKKLSERFGDKEFFIVKCAFGGSNLYNDWRSPSSGAPYSVESKITGHCEHVGAGWCFNELISLTQSSLSILKERGYAPEICAFLWMQGESDAYEISTVENYISLYDKLLTDFRQSFSKYMKACIYVDAGISEQWRYYKEINAAKKLYAEQNGHEYISTIDEGLTTANEPHDEPDIAHYDIDSVVRLGELFAEKIKL